MSTPPSPPPTGPDPFAPPSVREDPTQAGASEAEKVRRDHIRHEASVRSIAYLYGLGALLTVVGAILYLVTLPRVEPYALGFLAGMAAVGVLSGLAAYWVWKLEPKAQVPVTAVAAIGLLSFPFGTLIGVYVLWLVWSPKGRFVLSHEYARIRAETPEVRYRTSLLVWVVLAILLAGIALGALNVIMRP